MQLQQTIQQTPSGVIKALRVTEPHHYETSGGKRRRAPGQAAHPAAKMRNPALTDQMVKIGETFERMLREAKEEYERHEQKRAPRFTGKLDERGEYSGGQNAFLGKTSSGRSVQHGSTDAYHPDEIDAMHGRWATDDHVEAAKLHHARLNEILNESGWESDPHATKEAHDTGEAIAYHLGTLHAGHKARRGG